MATSSRTRGPSRGTAEGRVQRAREADRRWSTPLGLVLLVADPDTSERDVVVAALSTSGVNCTWCATGAETLVQYGKLAPDAVLMSPLLDVVDALTVVRTIRDRDSLPILLGVGSGESGLVGPVLVAGATTAVTRPYDPAEVVRRLEAEVSRTASRVHLSYGPLELDPCSYSVRLHGEELRDLPLKEFELLRLLMTYADRVVTPEQIRVALWSDAIHAPSQNTVAVHVARLRARLGGAVVLRTIRGRGYRLTFEDHPHLA